MEPFQDLEDAYAGLPIVRQATGVMMERHACNLDEGFVWLRRFAEDADLSVAAAAAQVLRTAGERER